MTEPKLVTYRYQSPLGPLTILWEQAHATLWGLWFDEVVPLRCAHLASALSNSVPERTCAWLDCYFAQHELPPPPPVTLSGTELERQVWNYLRTIPYGHTTTYGAIAQALFPERGTRMARAVAQAIGRNPIALLVPCHRVLGAQGQLTGYAYGLTRKQQLLALEQRPKP